MEEKNYLNLAAFSDKQELESKKEPAPLLKENEDFKVKVILCTRHSLPKGYYFIGRFEVKDKLIHNGIPYCWAKDSKTGKWLGLLVPNNWRDALPPELLKRENVDFYIKKPKGLSKERRKAAMEPNGVKRFNQNSGLKHEHRGPYKNSNDFS